MLRLIILTLIGLPTVQAKTLQCDFPQGPSRRMTLILDPNQPGQTMILEKNTGSWKVAYTNGTVSDKGRIVRIRASNERKIDWKKVKGDLVSFRMYLFELQGAATSAIRWVGTFRQVPVYKVRPGVTHIPIPLGLPAPFKVSCVEEPRSVEAVECFPKKGIGALRVVLDDAADTATVLTRIRTTGVPHRFSWMVQASDAKSIIHRSGQTVIRSEANVDWSKEKSCIKRVAVNRYVLFSGRTSGHWRTEIVTVKDPNCKKYPKALPDTLQPWQALNCRKI